MKIGVVYYSRTGNTRHVAKILEKKLQEKNTEADLIEIEHIKKPGFFTAGKAGTKQLELPMKNTDFDMSKYDIIITGSPTWNGRPSPFIKSFLDKAKNMRDKHIALFSTGLSPLNDREKFKEIMNNNLEKAGLNPFTQFLALKFRKGKLLDGEQNIDTFIDTVLNL